MRFKICPQKMLKTFRANCADSTARAIQFPRNCYHLICMRQLRIKRTNVFISMNVTKANNFHEFKYHLNWLHRSGSRTIIIIVCTNVVKVWKMLFDSVSVPLKNDMKYNISQRKHKSHNNAPVITSGVN